MRALEARVFPSITEIERSEWDQLRPPNPFVSYGWLKAAETTALTPPKLRYILLYSQKGLLGAVINAAIGPERGSVSLNEIMLGRAARLTARLGLSFEPALVCATSEVRGSTFLTRRVASSGEQAEILRELLTTLQEMARHERLPLAVCGVSHEERNLMDGLESSGFHRSMQFPAAQLIPQWDSFGSYLRAIGTRSRAVAKDIRRERNKLAKSGTIIDRFIPESSDGPRLLDLANSNYQKYRPEPFPYRHAFFSMLAEQMKDDAVFYGGWKAGRLVAFSLMVKTGNDAWGVYCGWDRAVCGNDQTYFNIVFNRPIEDAISDRLSSLNYGPGLLDLKLRRGCHSVPLYIFYWSQRSSRHLLLGPGLKLRSRYIACKVSATARAVRMRRLKKQ